MQRLNVMARLRRFAEARGGNVAMLWALGAVVCCGLVGLSIDFAQAQSLRAQMQNAADGAALVAERSSNLPLNERVNAARAFYDATLGDQASLTNVSFAVTQLPEGGHRVRVGADMEMSLTRVVVQDDWRIVVESDSVSEASPPIEVVLVLDNTGSMSNDMDTLRDGAEEMVDFLYNIDGDTVRMALVPFVAQVNIGNSAAHRAAWMDTAGTSPMNGELVEDRAIAVRSRSGTNNCTNLSTMPFNGYTGTYRLTWVRHGNNCIAYTPDTVNYFTLFDYMPNVSWGGCVEARPMPYDIQDNPPNSPETRFTPFFWLDTLDSGSNSYLQDTSGNISGATMSNGIDTTPTTSERNRAYVFNIFRYRGNNANLDTTPPETRGPNRGCPTPIVPLTDDRQTMIDAVRAMRHWNGGGTNQAEGLAWGWRVVSPGEPFTEGEPYGDDVRKVIVLMSDGQNTNVGNDSVWGSDYSSFNHLDLWTEYADGSLLNGLYGLIGGILHGTLPSQYRRAITGSSSYVSHINARQRALCDNIRAENVEVYTVMFRETDGTARDLLRYCATDEDHYFTAETQEELREVFRAIGSGIGQLRITR
ncbi:MAG: pilus assembly protein TadG-related protein [Hyphomonadaceae bacterium]